MSPKRIGGVAIGPDLAAAAKAPRSLLYAAIAADAKFCARFGYEDVQAGIAGTSRLPKHRLSDVSIAI
jgi:hypothetical protein